MSAESIQLDDAQSTIWKSLEETQKALQNHKSKPLDKPAEEQSAEKPSRWKKWFSAKIAEPSTSTSDVTGIYLWGDVGRGKTVLMRRFAAGLPQAQIIHFHAFMQRIHELLQEYSDQIEPIFWATRTIALDYDVLCLDEFIVSDITDAMILAKILKYLDQHGIVLFTTSNFPPDELYKDGLQRSQFIPAIEHIEATFSVYHLDNQIDYRQDLSKVNQHYFMGADAEDEFRKLCKQHFGSEGSDKIRIQSRDIQIKGQTDGALWVSFDKLCNTARSQLDYIELTKRYECIFLDDVPVMEDEQRDITRRFMILIDVLYDQSTKVFIKASKPINELYNGWHWKFEFARTESRLHEMTRG